MVDLVEQGELVLLKAKAPVMEPSFFRIPTTFVTITLYHVIFFALVLTVQGAVMLIPLCSWRDSAARNRRQSLLSKLLLRLLHVLLNLLLLFLLHLLQLRLHISSVKTRRTARPILAVSNARNSSLRRLVHVTPFQHSGGGNWPLTIFRIHRFTTLILVF